MEKLNLPEYNFKIKNRDGKIAIFDSIRKKYVVLTPEEWVRQNLVEYLNQYLNYPKSLVKLESGLKYNQLKKRSDILVFDREGAPFMLVECKSPKVSINQKAFDQAAGYNYTIKAPYIVVTNGIKHYCCKIDHTSRKISFQAQLPRFS